MPGRDQSGPRGMGAMTGRGLGFCSAYRQAVGSRNSRMRSFGAGMGFGRSFNHRQRRRWVNGPAFTAISSFGARPSDDANPDAALEKHTLQSQVSSLQAQLNVLQEKLAGMGDTDSSQ